MLWSIFSQGSRRLRRLLLLLRTGRCLFYGFAFYESSALILRPKNGTSPPLRARAAFGDSCYCREQVDGFFMGFAFYEGSALILPPERLSLSGLCNRSAPNFTLSSLFIQLQNAHKRLLGYFHRAQLAHPLLCLPIGKKRAFLLSAYSSSFSTLINASWGTSTVPNWRIRFFASRLAKSGPSYSLLTHPT